MSSDQSSNLAKNIQAKMNIVKIVGAIVVVSTLSAGGYYAYKKFTSESGAASETATSQTACPPGQEYNDKCGYCTPECGSNATYSCLTRKCECKTGLVGDPYNECVCVNNTYPTSSGTCSTTGQFACPTGKLVCPWDPTTCYSSGTCSTNIIDPNTGRLLAGARIPVPCGTGTVCVEPGSRAYNLAIAANPGILDNICRSVTCQCNDPASCSYPECGANPRRFVGWSSSEGKCVINRDCTSVPSKYVNLVTGSINRSCLVQQADPLNPANCSDLSHSQLKNICEMDSNGCSFGYTYDSASGFCKNSGGQTATRGTAGCRAPGDNTQMVGYNCALNNTKYYIVPEISLSTSSQITGQFYLNNSSPPTKINRWEYSIFAANPTTGRITGSVVSTGYFIPVLSGTKAVTNPTTGVNNNFPNYTFNIPISGIGNNPYLTLGNYRILFSGYQETSGVFNMVYASASNGAADYQLSGDMFVVSVLNNPAGIAASLMVIPTAANSQAVITNLGKSNILNNVFSNGGIELQNQPPPTGKFEMIPYQGLSYGLISCDRNLCGVVFDKMTAVIAWNTNNITIPSGKYLKFYVTRTNPPPLTTQNIINVASSGSLHYIADLQMIDNTFIYQIRTILADTATEIITETSYQTYYSRGEASAPRQLAVYLPQYTTSICNSIPSSAPPLFNILVNPSTGNFSGYSSTNIATTPLIGSNVTMTISPNLSYMPNYYATVTSQNDVTKFFILLVSSYNSSTGVLVGRVDSIQGNPSGSTWNITMASGDRGQGGYCMSPQMGMGAVNSYYDWYCNARYNGPSASSRNLTSFGQIGSTGTVYLWNQEANGCVPVLPNKKPTVQNYAAIMSGTAEPSQITSQQWISGVDVTVNAGCGCVGSECPAQGVTSLFSYGGNVIESNRPPGSVGNYNDLKTRLADADTFGVQYVNGWSGSNGTLYDSMINNLYACPLNTSPDYYNNAANCAAGDSECIAIANKLNCSQNSCGTLQLNPSSNKAHSYSESVRWLPDISNLTTTQRNNLACSGKGTYTRNNNGTGVCTCNFGFGGPNCAGSSILPNATGCIGAVNGVCGPDALAAPEQCALYVSPNDTANNPLQMVVPPGLQKFVPSSQGGVGCVVNYNPLAWADVVGVAAHASQYTPGFPDGSTTVKDGWICKNNNGRFIGSLGLRSNNSNACAITPTDLNNAISTGRISSPMTRITYDFSKVKPNSLTQPFLNGPYSRFQDGMNYPQNIPNPPSYNYTGAILEWQMNAVGVGGIYPGASWSSGGASLDAATTPQTGATVVNRW